MDTCDEHIPSDGRVVAEAMNTIVEHLIDSDAVEAVWYDVYPDGTDGKDLEELSSDADMLDSLFRTFRKLIATVGKDGLCVEDEEGLLLIGNDKSKLRFPCLKTASR